MTDSPRPVLVGIDGTPSGLEALALGSLIATLTGSPLLLAAAYGFTGLASAGLSWPPEDDAQRWLDDAQARLDGAVRCSTRTIEARSPAHGLVTLAKDEDVSMVVLGSNPDGPIGRVLAGSTGRRVANGAPCAVAIASHQWRPRPDDAPPTIGAALTDSAESRDALAVAAGLAAAAEAPLKVFTVVDVPAVAHPMFAAGTISHERWRLERLDDAERMARGALEQLDATVQSEIVALEGDALERLTEASRDVDLLVVGSRRYGPVRSVLLGGVSAPLIECAASPVVIVPRGVDTEGAPGA